MKMRFSNERDTAIEFSANDVNEFFDQAVSALRSFRIQTERRVHQGEIGRTRSWFDTPALHVYSETLQVWQDPLDRIQSHFKLSFQTNQADTLDDMHKIDAVFMKRVCTVAWRGCVEANLWADELNVFVMSFGDTLQREIDADTRRKLAAALGSISSPAKTAANRAKANLPPKPGKRPRGRPRKSE